MASLPTTYGWKYLAYLLIGFFKEKLKVDRDLICKITNKAQTVLLTLGRLYDIGLRE